MIKHLKYDEAIAEAREREGKRELSDAAALTLCAAWHSSGTVGRYLAAVSTGAWSPESLTVQDEDDTRITRGDEFRTDLYETFRGATKDSEEMLVWSMLGTWSMNGGDND